MPVTFRNEQFSLIGQFSPIGQRFAWPKPGSVLETVGAELVRELARVGWDVPGIDVEFGTTGKGTNVVRRVHTISGETERGPFRLTFRNVQEQVGQTYHHTGLSDAAVPPGIEIRYWGNDHTLVANVYSGSDWLRDAKSFMDEFKKDYIPHLYRSYTAQVSPERLDADVRLGAKRGREDGPLSVTAGEVTGPVVDFIRDELIAKLRLLPSAEGHDDINEQGDANLRRLAQVEPIEAPEDFPVLYCWVDRNSAHRILGKSHGSYSDGSGDYVVDGTGWRLMNLSDLPRDANPRDFHPKINGYFSYASSDPAVKAAGPSNAVDYLNLPVEIKLRYLNDVLVADMAAYDDLREEMWQQVIAEGRKEFTGDEIRRSYGALARTVVSAADYDGSYKRPTYLIGRQLHADEARLIRGPVWVHVEKERVRALVKDEETGNEIALAHYEGSEWRKLGRWAVKEATEVAQMALSLLSRDIFRSNYNVKVIKDHEFPDPWARSAGTPAASAP